MISYSFTKHAERDLSRLPLNVQKRIIKKIETFLSSADPFFFAERLTGVPGQVYRFRIGDYRVIFDRLEGEILITLIGHRRDVYKGSRKSK